MGLSLVDQSVITACQQGPGRTPGGPACGARGGTGSAPAIGRRRRRPRSRTTRSGRHPTRSGDRRESDGMAMTTSDRSATLRDFVHRVLIVVAVVALALALWSVARVVLLVFGSVLLAILLRGLAGWIAKRTPLSEGWALAAAVGLVLAVLGGGI